MAAEHEPFCRLANLQAHHPVPECSRAIRVEEGKAATRGASGRWRQTESFSSRLPRRRGKTKHLRRRICASVQGRIPRRFLQGIEAGQGKFDWLKLEKF